MKREPRILSFSGLSTFFKKLRLYEILLIVLVVLILAVWGIKRTTESAVFCGNSCHVMRPHYDEWKNSSHNNVPCIECHLPPSEDQQFYPDFRALGRVLNYLTRTYGRYTRAEVEDTACLREGCHSHRLLEGSVTYTGDITFNHTPHLQQLRRGKILRCTTCHARNVMGEHITVVHDTCFICHFKGDSKNLYTAQCLLCHQNDTLSEKDTGSGINHGVYIQRSVPCLSCHDGVISGTGQLDENSCNQCHGPSSPDMLLEPVETLHRTHVTDHKVECSICHMPIRHQSREETADISLECDSCHENKHTGITGMYRGTGASGLSPDPSPMFKSGVDCVGCHRLPAPGSPQELRFTGKTLIAAEKECSQCHGKDMSGYIEAWTAEINAALVRAERALERAETSIGKVKGTGTLQDAEGVINEARYNIAFVRASSPIHNSGYAVSVLEKTATDLDGLVTAGTQR